MVVCLYNKVAVLQTIIGSLFSWGKHTLCPYSTWHLIQYLGRLRFNIHLNRYYYKTDVCLRIIYYLSKKKVVYILNKIIVEWTKQLFEIQKKNFIRKIYFFFEWFPHQIIFSNYKYLCIHKYSLAWTFNTFYAGQLIFNEANKKFRIIMYNIAICHFYYYCQLTR